MRRSSRGCRSGAAAKKENSMWTVVVQLRGTRALPLKGSIGLQLGLQLPTGGRFFLISKQLSVDFMDCGFACQSFIA